MVLYSVLPDTWRVILDAWFMAPTLDIWHRHLIYYIWYLIHDTWYLTTALDMLYLIPDLRHLILDTGTWYMSYLSPDPDPRYMTHANPYLTCFHWYKYIDLTLWPLTGHYHPWYLYYMTYSWLSLLRGLGMIIILLSNIWYSWTHVYLNPWNREAPDITPDIILLLTPVIG